MACKIVETDNDNTCWPAWKYWTVEMTHDDMCINNEWIILFLIMLFSLNYHNRWFSYQYSII